MKHMRNFFIKTLMLLYIASVTDSLQAMRKSGKGKAPRRSAAAAARHDSALPAMRPGAVERKVPGVGPAGEMPMSPGDVRANAEAAALRSRNVRANADAEVTVAIRSDFPMYNKIGRVDVTITPRSRVSVDSKIRGRHETYTQVAEELSKQLTAMLKIRSCDAEDTPLTDGVIQDRANFMRDCFCFLLLKVDANIVKYCASIQCSVTSMRGLQVDYSLACDLEDPAKNAKFLKEFGAHFERLKAAHNGRKEKLTEEENLANIERFIRESGLQQLVDESDRMATIERAHAAVATDHDSASPAMRPGDVRANAEAAALRSRNVRANADAEVTVAIRNDFPMYNKIGRVDVTITPRSGVSADSKIPGHNETYNQLARNLSLKLKDMLKIRSSDAEDGPLTDGVIQDRIFFMNDCMLFLKWNVDANIAKHCASVKYVVTSNRNIDFDYNFDFTPGEAADNERFLKEFGEHLEKLRAAHNLKEEKLAEKENADRQRLAGIRRAADAELARPRDLEATVTDVEEKAALRKFVQAAGKCALSAGFAALAISTDNNIPDSGGGSCVIS